MVVYTRYPGWCCDLQGATLKIVPVTLDASVAGVSEMFHPIVSLLCGSYVSIVCPRL